MFDLFFFSASGVGILVALLFRYLYSKSLTGLIDGRDAVGVNYWGSYQNGAIEAGKIQLPAVKGICPACQQRSLSNMACAHQLSGG